jgi:hypothetical protein
MPLFLRLRPTCQTQTVTKLRALRHFASGVAVMLLSLAAHADTPAVDSALKTVCTITINSSDEKDAFMRHLPRGEYRHVELVQRGQTDWFGAARRSGVVCDALIISGHFDDGTEFYTDRFDDREFLTVHELQRASCSAPAKGLFSQLKDVYLFGCNTLKSEARYSASAEITRSLLRSGQSSADAERVSALLSQRYGQSNRDRLRHVFKDVPVLYGFSSKAPLGRTAGPLLERYFQTAPVGEVASGRVSPTLLKLFGPSSMIAVAGVTNADPHISFQRDVCGLADERPSEVQRLAFLHEVLQRDVSQVRMMLEPLERYVASISPAQRLMPDVVQALADIEHDEATRDRFLTFARDADQATVLTRMMALARSLKWLTAAQERAELLRMVGERMARDSLGLHEVDLVCAASAVPDPIEAAQVLATGAARSSKVAHSAVLACLGHAEAHHRTIAALTGARDDDLAIAQVYLRHRPLVGVAEVRLVTAGIGRMGAGDGQVRALDTLARQRVADPQSLQEVANLFPLARSLDAQRAIAGILIRADHRSLARTDLLRSLRQHRLKSLDGNDVIDALIRVLQTT